jgi:site-specific recombinase XerD
MTPLRERMLVELARRNYADKTQRNYIQCVAQFARYFKTAPDKLGEDHIRQYQLHLLERGVSWSHFNVTTSALRFFFCTALGQNTLVKQIPFGKRPKTLPLVLTVAEVLRLIEASPTPKYKTMFVTLYGCALRLGECCRLRVRDIDSTERQLHVRAGKGSKDRSVPLSEKQLEHLRRYWRTVRSTEWLFPGGVTGRPISTTAVQRAFRSARLRAEIKKPVGPHVLRHSCATHLLEAGTDIRIIQKLLGHAHLETTLIYTQVSTKALQMGLGRLEHLESLL